MGGGRATGAAARIRNVVAARGSSAWQHYQVHGRRSGSGGSLRCKDRGCLPGAGAVQGRRSWPGAEGGWRRRQVRWSTGGRWTHQARGWRAGRCSCSGSDGAKMDCGTYGDRSGGTSRGVGLVGDVRSSARLVLLHELRCPWPWRWQRCDDSGMGSGNKTPWRDPSPRPAKPRP